jgi:hypothetical protein
MPKWTEYTSKNTLADNDEVMLYDATARANKRGLMSKFWDYVVDKMATAVISKLETNNKTIIGAINALNSDSLKINPIKDYVSDADVVTTIRALVSKGQRFGCILFVGASTGLPDGLTFGVVEYLTPYGTGIIYLRYNNEVKYYRGVIPNTATVPTWTSLI